MTSFPCSSRESPSEDKDFPGVGKGSRRSSPDAVPVSDALVCRGFPDLGGGGARGVTMLGPGGWCSAHGWLAVTLRDLRVKEPLPLAGRWAGMSEPLVVELGPRDLLVVAGLPGAGKTTMLRRAAGGVVVLDSEQVRERLGVVPLPYRFYRPLVHAWHRLRIVGRAMGCEGPVVVHEPATRASTRVLLALVGVVSGRAVRLLFLDVPAEVALAGQVSRGRVVRARAFARHVRRVGKWRGDLLAGRVPVGWCSVVVVDRGGAGRVRFVGC
ncbi:AAA family ATPase [Amycolatopsis sp. NPDC049688]|uniref:AAA family ATPase n=1 Tax=Amycolatopsis sp. NPDC049688 TaxID=3154733 RepID=UPI00342A6C84